MTQINAYLTFEGNCRDAMTFYHACLGGELEMQTIGGSPVEDECPAAMRDQILHAVLTKEILLLMGSDMVGQDGFTNGNNVTLSLNCDSQLEIDRCFHGLSAGGRILHELRVEFWGATFGVFCDKFGIRWMLNYDPKQTHSHY